MSQTYDPLLEVTELRRLRMAPVRGPAMGTALVLERSLGDPVVVWPGQRVPDARTGKYRRMYVVDVATRGLSYTEQVLSKDQAFPFSVTVNFACQVVDPIVIAKDNIHDMTAALRTSLSSVVRTVAADFDVLEAAAAEAMITTKLSNARSDAAVRLSAFAVTVTAVDAAEIITAQRELRVQEMKREAMKPVADGGRAELMAQVMALTNGDPTALLDREEVAKQSSTQAALDALRVLMGSSEPLEGFDASRIGDQAMNTFFPGGLPLSPTTRGLRGRIERRSRKAIDGGQVIDEKPDGGAEPRKSDGADPPKTDDRNPPTRLRGSAVGMPTGDDGE